MLGADLLRKQLTLYELTVYVVDLPQRETFTSGIGVRKSRQAVIVRWVDQEGRTGYGEVSCRPDPYYSGEFVDGAKQVIESFIVPALSGEQTVAELMEVLSRIRGWNFTKSAVETAALRVLRQQYPGLNIFTPLEMDPLEKVPVGISMGIETEEDVFVAKVKAALDAGYRRLKFKIKPGVDIDLFESIKPMVKSAGVVFGFDANGSMGLDDLDLLDYFTSNFSEVIEQPFSPNRFDVLLEARKQLPRLKYCFDEEIKSLGDLMKLHQLGVCDEVNLKVGRVGGTEASLAVLQYCHKHDIPCWIGAMFESGIGRTWNLEFASYLPKAKAHDLSPSQRYFLEDLMDPGVTMDQGYIDMKSLQACQVIPERLEKYAMSKTVHPKTRRTAPC